MCAIKMAAFRVMYVRQTLSEHVFPHQVSEIVSYDLSPCPAVHSTTVQELEFQPSCWLVVLHFLCTGLWFLISYITNKLQWLQKGTSYHTYACTHAKPNFPLMPKSLGTWFIQCYVRMLQSSDQPVLSLCNMQRFCLERAELNLLSHLWFTNKTLQSSPMSCSNSSSSLKVSVGLLYLYCNSNLVIGFS